MYFVLPMTPYKANIKKKMFPLLNLTQNLLSLILSPRWWWNWCFMQSINFIIVILEREGQKENSPYLPWQNFQHTTSWNKIFCRAMGDVSCIMSPQDTICMKQQTKFMSPNLWAEGCILILVWSLLASAWHFLICAIYKAWNVCYTPDIRLFVCTFISLFVHLTAGLGGSIGCTVRLETRRSRVQPPPRSATFFRGDWSWNIFYGHSLPSADSRRAVVSFWRKNVHNTG